MHTDSQQHKKIFDGTNYVNGLLHIATPMDVKMHKCIYVFQRAAFRSRVMNFISKL